MTKIEKRAYNAFTENQLAEKSMFKDARSQGFFEGRKEGKAEGKAEEIADDFDVSGEYVLTIQKTL